MTHEQDAIRAHIKERYGREVFFVQQFGKGRVNSNYLVEAHDDLHIFRVYEEKNKEEIGCELALLDTLEGVDYPSQKVRRTVDGLTSSEFEGRPAILASYIEGEPARELNETTLAGLGALMARLHLACKNVPLCANKPTWEPDALIMLLAKEGRVFGNSGVAHAKQIVAFCETAFSRFSFPKELPKGGTHQDMKKENIILLGEKISGVIDFDNAYTGAWLHDITTALMWGGYVGDELRDDRLRAFMNGYQSVRPLEMLEERCLVEAFKHRLAREAFIGPFAAVTERDSAAETSLRFMELYERFGAAEAHLLTESLIS